MKDTVKTVLLDEPDKHMDPKLIEKFVEILKSFANKKIKVIMTTHRPDTISLIHNSIENVFYKVDCRIEKNKVKEIKPLEALFRMTSNLRGIVNYHHKVYIESLNDSEFYEGVYNSLMRYCSEIRKDNPKEKYYLWTIDVFNLNNKRINQEEFRLLSRRCQLSFHGVSEFKNGDGSCNKVILAVQKDLNNIIYARDRNRKDKKAPLIVNDKYFNSKWFLGEPELHSSYGILDFDNGKTKELLESKVNKLKLDPMKGLLEKVRENIQICEKYYTLENFAFDPFVFYSTLSDQDIDKLITESNVSKDVELLNQLKGIRITDKNNSLLYDYKKTDENLQKYFKFLWDRLQIKLEKNKKGFEDAICKVAEQGKKEDKKKTELLSAIEKIITNANEPINNRIIVSIDKALEVTYHKFILEMKGHDIEEFLFENNFGKQVVERIVSNIYSKGLEMIPVELAKVFFGLNEKVITLVRRVTGKPKKQSVVAGSQEPEEQSSDLI